ncbi:MAG: hypothetical protein AAB669_02445 [Patescibacteria group bacterium]
MGKISRRESLLILVFAAFVYIVIFFVSGKEHRGDISMGFTLGLLFAIAISLIKPKENNG